VVLLLIALFSAIGGKPLDGLLMLLVVAGLAWDARPGQRHAPAVLADGSGTERETAGIGPEGIAGPEGIIGPEGIRAAADGAPQPNQAGLLRGFALLLGGLLYAVLAASFPRFSWPATVAVISLGAAVVLAGWRGPVRARPVVGRLPRRGLAAWGAVLAAGGMWELWSLFQQPGFSVTSYAHPTISALTDPVLAAEPGRAVVLAGWLLLGWYLVRR
jgi:hypothetical protein